MDRTRAGVESPTFGVGLGDIDGDGDLDAVTVDAYSDMEVYLNDGTGTFSYETTYGSDNDWFGVYLVDIDLDDDLDIIASAFYSGEGCDVYKNNGFGSFTLFQGDIATSISMRHIAIVDVTGDGYPDIFAPAYSSAQLRFGLTRETDFLKTPINHWEAPIAPRLLWPIMMATVI